MTTTRRKAITLFPTCMVAASGFSPFGVAQIREGAQNAPDPPADIVAVIDTVFRAFNSKDFALLKSVYGDNLVIIDGFGRYRWIGSNALAEWWADAETWAKDGGIESEHLSSQGIRAWGVGGDRAYASVSATLTIKLKKGEPIVRPGILTFTFGKLGERWKAEGHAWGRLS
jgi:ketosteroid isomerase-like protein